MICIFCKKDSSQSKSVEHIIPESLGNRKNVLPKGIVCDGCNGYFGRKIEQYVLALPFFSQLRARNLIPSKKDRIPAEKLLVYHNQVDSDDHEALFIRRKKGIPVLSTPWAIGSKLLESSSAKLLVESLEYNYPPKNDILVARFLAKIAIEVLTQSVIDNRWSMSTIVADERLDSIRNFARYGMPGKKWEYYVRQVYGENDTFFYDDDMNSPVDVLYNYGNFFIEQEMFLSLILKGYEFTINLGLPEIGTYIRWLLINKGDSAIHKTHIIGKNIFPIPLLRLG